VQIIPVLDLQGGCVVRAVGGRRNEYRPIQSILTANAAPEAVLDAFIERFAFRAAYVADLDGILGKGADFQRLAQLACRPIDFMVDAGVESPNDAQRLIDLGISKVVAASESLPSIDVLADLIERCSADRIVFSMDLNDGKPLVADQEWNSKTPEAIVDAAGSRGTKQFILLDLADVGESTGSRTLPLLARLRERCPRGWFAAGGGVRNIEDVNRAKRAGADAMLVASALHDGRITPGDLAQSSVKV